jgi:hypothetical protein
MICRLDEEGIQRDGARFSRLPCVGQRRKRRGQSLKNVSQPGGNSRKVQTRVIAAERSCPSLPEGLNTRVVSMAGVFFHKKIGVHRGRQEKS